MKTVNVDEKGNLQTEYQSVFKKYRDVVKRKTWVPPVNEHYDSNCLPPEKSTYKRTFIKHPLPKKFVVSKQCYVAPETLLNGKTTYGESFTKKKGSRPGSFKPEYVYVPPETSVQKYSVYSSYYRPPEPDDWGWCRASPIKHKECIQRDDVPMETSSTMKEDYCAHPEAERVKPIIPTATPLDGGQFDGHSTYAQEFTTKPISPPPVRARRQYTAPTDPFYGETTARESYQAYDDGHRPASFKPPNGYEPCPVRFEDDTTTSSAYRQWDVIKPEKPSWAQPKVYEAPVEPVEGHSSYQEEYPRYRSAERAQLQKPRGDGIQFAPREVGQIQRGSLYTREFQSYPEATPPKSYQIIKRYEPPAESMEKQSAYQSEYRGRKTSRAQPIIPVSNQIQNTNEPSHFSTTYQGTYSSSKFEKTPSHMLPAAGKPSNDPRKARKVTQDANRSNNSNILEIELPVRRVVPQRVAAGVPSGQMIRHTGTSSGMPDHGKPARSKSLDPARLLYPRKVSPEASTPRRTSRSRRQPSASPPRRSVGSVEPVPIRAGRARPTKAAPLFNGPVSDTTSSYDDAPLNLKSERAVTFADNDSVDMNTGSIVTEVSSAVTAEYVTAASSVTSTDDHVSRDNTAQPDMPKYEENDVQPSYKTDKSPVEDYIQNDVMNHVGDNHNDVKLTPALTNDLESF